MASSIEEIESLVQEAISTGFRGRLLERGLARSMIWSEGELPDGAPNFAKGLSYDLLSYGYTLLSLAIRLRELNGNEDLCRVAYEKSAIAISDVIQSGNPNDPEKGFHKVLAASAYHLGRFSAKAFSLINANLENENLSRMEYALSLLMLRQLDKLEALIMNWKVSGVGSDASLATKLEVDIDQLNQVIGTDTEPEEFGITSIEIPVVDLALTDNYYSALFEFLFALETGNQLLVENSISNIDNSLSVSSDLNMLPQWWILRITKHLLNDLWESSFHRIIPVTPNQEYNDEWSRLRWLFIASLFKRSKAEIDLWPSQLEGASRAVNDLDNLVVSLPTSAGKTRIAELCILRCLAIGKRILFITPLRALSAQTESSLRKTFLPLGKSVSSLYGSMGTSDFEQDVLKTQDIVVGTPEKLDFALRNDPTIIDDVGLIVLDEGHMIGLSEREINYEVQIQRLLRREDANERRIVCLSAILPEGDQFEDFVGWLRQDKEGEAVQSDWRPTDLRFGEIIWQNNNTGRIDFMTGEEQAFIPNYIQPMIPSYPNPGKRTTPFPKNVQELTLATAWRLIQDKHTVLIYCPQRTSVDAFSKAIIDLHQRGALESILSVPEKKLEVAKTLGHEWLGENHPIIQCLSIGVAVHHGALPTPFRKEMEKLLRDGTLKITVSSPTLAQGLNLTATAIIVHSLYRSGDLIDVSEFKNVIGRAGRAFIDTHGVVLHPIFDKHDWRKEKWRELVHNTNARNMESGLVRLVLSLLKRMNSSIGDSSILEYVMNNISIWNFPEVATEEVEERDEQKSTWNRHIVFLDAVLLSLLGTEEIPINEIPDTLDTILQSSLWQRRLNRHDDEIKQLFDAVLAQRAKYIWSVTTPQQRKGYFLAGVGLETGQLLDNIADQVNGLLLEANAAILKGEQLLAISTITNLAELLFDIPPFVPNPKPNNWRDILKVWLEGDSFTNHNFGDVDTVLRFVEDALIYRLPWGVEAVRVRAQANQDVIIETKEIKNYRINQGGLVNDPAYELGLVVPAIENGTLNRSAALLMQAGFNSRNAAIQAVTATNASFTNGYELKNWLDSDAIQQRTQTSIWPTPETSTLWKTFLEEYQPKRETTWEGTAFTLSVNWFQIFIPTMGVNIKLWNAEDGNTLVLGSSGERIGQLDYRYNLLNSGIYYTTINRDVNYIEATYWGKENNPFEIF